MHKLVKELKLPLLLIAETILCLSFGHLVPESVKSGFYALSLTIKEILLFGLPFLIFAFISASLANLKKGALSFIIIAFSLVVLSNFLGTTLAGILGVYTLSFLENIHGFQTKAIELSPLWNLHFPSLLSNDAALISGLVFGCFAGFYGHKPLINGIQKAQHYGLLILKKAFIPIIPLFVLGFVLKMDHEGMLDVILNDYLSVFLAITLIGYGYMILLYGFCAGFRITKWRQSLQRMVPAVITGFSTMSSASALPLIVNAAEKTTKNKIVSGIVPLSINIHMIGDCFAISIMALAILTSFGMPLPTPMEYMMYTVFFVLARFSVAAVPGGGIIVILPILERYLGFTGDMLSLILALYILFDPIATSANVFGNGFFAILFEKVYSYFQKTNEPNLSTANPS